jgi:Smg protein
LIVNQENNNMFDILVYVFENCRQADVSHDPERVAKKLSAAGFEDHDISTALSWLAGVVRAPQRSLAPLPGHSNAFRAFAVKERAKLDVECMGFLLYLEQSGILNPTTREHVLERALAAAGDSLSLEQLKLIVLMVLWNQRTPASQLIAEELLSARGERLPS